MLISKQANLHFNVEDMDIKFSFYLPLQLGAILAEGGP